MTLVEHVLPYRSLAIVGMAKNAGKTTCLNHLLDRLEERGRRPAITSIGIDGERLDSVYQTPKPEITARAGTLFLTSERDYRARRLVAEILEVSDRRTALGRLVTARAITAGKIILSGPPDTRSLREWIEGTARFGADITLVDGALSRRCHGSPAVTAGIILVTGAAVAGNIERVARETRRLHQLTLVEAAGEETARKLSGIERGIHAIDEEGTVHDLHLPSAFLLEGREEALLSRGPTLFVAGAVTDGLLRLLATRRDAGRVTLVARDFTRLIAGSEATRAFRERGGRLRVLLKSQVVAACVNPYSPRGPGLDPVALLEATREALDGVPVYDVKRME